MISAPPIGTLPTGYEVIDMAPTEKNQRKHGGKGTSPELEITPASDLRDRLEKSFEHIFNPDACSQTTVCLDCRAVSYDGHWYWDVPPEDAGSTLCPACRHVRKKSPTAFLKLEGRLIAKYTDDILNFVRDHETCARSRDPMKQFIGIVEKPDKLILGFTDLQLARDTLEILRCIYGDALHYHCIGRNVTSHSGVY